MDYLQNIKVIISKSKCSYIKARDWKKVNNIPFIIQGKRILIFKIVTRNFFANQAHLRR